MSPSRDDRRPVWRAAVCATVLTVAGGLVGCSSDEPAAQIEADPVIALVRPVKWQERYELTRDYVGRVEPRREVAAAFDLAGRVDAIAFDEGDTVPVGDRIAVLQTDRLISQRATLQAQRDAAAAVLDELVAGPRDEAIAAARAEVRRLKAQLELADLTTGRQERLSSRGATTGQTADEARLAAAAAKASLEAAYAKLNELETGTRVEKLAAQRAAIARIDAEIDRVELEITKSSLFAPFPAVVADRMVDEGATVTSGQAIVRLMEQGRWRLRIGVPADVAETLVLGDRFDAAIRGRDYPVVLAAARRDRVDATRTVPLLFELTEAASESEPSFFDGDLARISLRRDVSERGFWLPIAALVEGVRGLWACYVAVPIEEEGRKASHQLVRVPLELLHNDEERAFVRGPVDPDALVVVDGTHRLVPKQSVTTRLVD